MTYSLSYQELRATYDGRNAFYKIATISRPDRESVVLKQWGAIGAVGQSKKQILSHHAAAREYADVIHAKLKKGYVKIDWRSAEANDPNGLEMALRGWGFTQSAFDAEELSDIPAGRAGRPEPTIEEESKAPAIQPAGWGDW